MAMGRDRKLEGPGCGTGESHTLQIDKLRVAGLRMAVRLPPSAVWPQVWYLPVHTCCTGPWPFFETFSLRVVFGWAQAFIKFLGSGRFEARLVKRGEGRWENGLRRRVFHYPVIASLTRVLLPRSSTPKLRAPEKRRKGGGVGGKHPSRFGRQHPPLSRQVVPQFPLSVILLQRLVFTAGQQSWWTARRAQGIWNKLDLL